MSQPHGSPATLRRHGQACESFVAALAATHKGYVAEMLEAYDPGSAPAGDVSSGGSAFVPVTSSVNAREL